MALFVLFQRLGELTHLGDFRIFAFFNVLLLSIDFPFTSKTVFLYFLIFLASSFATSFKCTMSDTISLKFFGISPSDAVMWFSCGAERNFGSSLICQFQVASLGNPLFVPQNDTGICPHVILVLLLEMWKNSLVLLSSLVP